MPQLISSSKWYEKERMLRLLEFFGRVADGLRPPLLALPLDLFVKIVSLLHLEDIAALGHVSFQVMCMLQNDVVAHDIVKFIIPHSREAKLARGQPCFNKVEEFSQWSDVFTNASFDGRNGSISHASAVSRVLARRRAFTSNRPVSALSLGPGSSFRYEDGFLCYLRAGMVRILDVSQAAETEIVVDIIRLLSQVVEKGKPIFPSVTDFNAERWSIDIIAFRSGILECLICYGEDLRDLFMLAINVVGREPIPDSARVLFATQSVENYPGHPILHTSYLYTGTRTQARILLPRQTASNAPDQDGHPWTLKHTSFVNNPEYERAILNRIIYPPLRDLQPRAFGVDGQWLYLVSLPLSDNEDGTSAESLYCCYRCPIEGAPYGGPCLTVTVQPGSRLEFSMVRRELPGSDECVESTTGGLRLLTDERTGDLIIAENRPCLIHSLRIANVPRAWHFHRVQFSNNDTSTEPAAKHPFSYVFGPYDEVGVRTCDSKTGAARDPPPHRYMDYSEHGCVVYVYQTCNLNASSFLEVLYFNGMQMPEPEESSIERPWPLSIRIGARHRPPPIDPETGLLAQKEIDKEHFVTGNPRIWPPTHADRELQNLLNPYWNSKCHFAMDSDESSLLYIVEADTEDQDESLHEDSYKRSDAASQGNADEQSEPSESAVTEMMRRFDEQERRRTKAESSTLVFVNYDPSLKFSGLEKMVLESPDAASDTTNIVEGLRRQDLSDSMKDSDKGKGKEVQTATQTPEANEESQSDWFRVEKAQWVEIGKGFEFIYR